MNFSSLFCSSVKKGSQLINYQTVRWRRPRKPFWLGIAKSKRFIVPQPRVTRTPEEKAQNLILNENYQAQINSLLNFIRNTDPKLEHAFSQTTSEGKTIYTSAFEEEMSKSFENNSAWNAESARRREKRLKQEKEKTVEAALKLMEIKEQERKKELEIIEEVARTEKLLSGSYITPENIDEEIEKCLNKIVNYDFAIDLQGNRYSGSESLRLEATTEKVRKVETTTNSTV